MVRTWARDRAKQLFGAEHANVQPHAGSAGDNVAGLCSDPSQPHTILGLNSAHGGHPQASSELFRKTYNYYESRRKLKPSTTTISSTDWLTGTPQDDRRPWQRISHTSLILPDAPDHGQSRGTVPSLVDMAHYGGVRPMHRCHMATFVTQQSARDLRRALE